MGQIQVYQSDVREQMPAGNRQSDAGVGALAQSQRAQIEQVGQVEKVVGNAADAMQKGMEQQAKLDVSVPLQKLLQVKTAQTAQMRTQDLGENAKTAPDRRMKAFDDAQGQIGGEITDPLVKKFYDIKAQDYRDQFSADVTAHVDEQAGKQRLDAAKNVVQQHQQEYIVAATQEGKDKALADIAGSLKEFFGYNDDQVKDALGKTMAQAALSYSMTGNAQAAYDEFKKAVDGGYIDPTTDQAMGKLQADLTAGKVKAEWVGKSADILKKKGTIVDAYNALDAEHLTVGSPDYEAAKKGINETFGQANVENDARIRDLTKKVYQIVGLSDSGWSKLPDTYINQLAALGSPYAAEFKRKKDLEVQNQIDHGDGFARAGTDDSDAVLRVQRLIRAGDISTEDEMRQYLKDAKPELTRASFVGLDKLLQKSDGILPISQLQTAFKDTTGKDAYKYPRLFTVFVDHISSLERRNVQFDLKQEAASWAQQPGTVPGIFSDAVDTTRVKALGDNKADKFKPVPVDQAGYQELTSSMAPAFVSYSNGLRRAGLNAIADKLDATLGALGHLDEKNGMLNFYATYGGGYRDWYDSHYNLSDVPMDDSITMAAYAIAVARGLRKGNPTLDQVNSIIGAIKRESGNDIPATAARPGNITTGNVNQ